MIKIELPILSARKAQETNDNIAMFRSIKCIILQLGIRPISANYHVCSCDPDRIHPICDNCFVACHQSKGHVSIKSSEYEAVCMCGMKYHQPLNEQVKPDIVYDKKCLFGEWSIVSKLNFMYSSPEFGMTCILCYNICLKDRQNSTRVSVNSQEQAKCDCTDPNHQDVRILFRKLTSLSKKNNFVDKYDFQNLTFVHFINLLTLSNDSYNNVFHSLYDGLSSLSSVLQTQQYSLEDQHYMFDLQLSSNVLSKFALKCKGNLNYFSEKLKNLISPELFSKAIERKFDYKSKNIWQLKHNMSNIFWIFSISRDFSGYPKFKIRDVELLNPLQRLMMISNIKNDISMNEYTSNNKFSLLECTFQMIHRVNKSKEKPNEAYFILHRLYQICQIFAKFSLFNNEQLGRLCVLNDEVLEKFEQSSQYDKNSIETTNAKLKVLSPMVKTILYLAYYFNDHYIQSFLKEEKHLDNVSFFHSVSSIGRIVSRNALNILTFISVMNKREEVSKENIERSENLSPHLNEDIEPKNAKIMKCLSNIVENANNIISLTIANPEYYSAGLIRIFDKNQEICLRYIDNAYDPIEESFVKKVQSLAKNIQNQYYDFYSRFTQDNHDLLVHQMNEILIEVIKECNIQDLKDFIHDIGSVVLDEERLMKDSDKRNGDINVNYIELKSNGNKKGSFIAKRKTCIQIKFGNSKDSLGNTHQKFRLLFNRTNFIPSMIKVIHVLHNYYLFSLKPQNTLKLDFLLDNIAKILHFYVTDNPDNSSALLMSDFTSAVEVLNGNDLLPMIEVIQYALHNILVFQYDLTSCKNVLHMIKVIARKLANSSENLITLDKVIKVIQILIRISFVKPQMAHGKLRKILKEIYHMNPIFRNYFRSSCRREERDIPIDTNEQNRGSGTGRLSRPGVGNFSGYDNKLVESVIKKFLRIINNLFDGDATLNEVDFLQGILNREDIPKILMKKNIDLPVRTEILKFFRMVYIDVVINANKITKYRSLVINDPVVPSEEDSIDNGESHKFYEELIGICKSDIVRCMDLECAVLKFELKFFTEIIQANKNCENHKMLEYTEHAIILPLCVYMSKFVSLIFHLNGYDYLKLYDLVYYFLQLKKYVITHREIFQANEVFKIKKIFKSKLQTCDNEMYHIINNEFTEADSLEVDKDLTEMDMQHFEILNFATVNGIFKKHINSFISRPKFKGLKDFFEKRAYVYSDEDIAKKHEKVREAGMLKTLFEENVFNVIMKYINEKNKLDKSAFMQMLEEDNSYFDKKYRYLLVTNCLYFMSNSKWKDKYKDSFQWTLFRLLQYDTVPAQKVFFEMYNNKSTLLDFENLLNNFTTSLISLFLKKSNPSTVMLNSDYFNAIILIKIFKYLCEEHNRKFQKIFFKEVKVKYLLPPPIKGDSIDKDTANGDQSGRKIDMKIPKPHPDEEVINEHEVTKSVISDNDENIDDVTIFEYMISILRKIILISKWDSSKSEKEINSFYYDIFFVIIEFIIETIQGTDQTNFETVFGIGGNIKPEHERNIFGAFLLSIKNVLLEGNPNSALINKIRNDLINFLMAFLEESSTPPTVVNEISSIILPNSVMENIVGTMNILYHKLNPGKKTDKGNSKSEFTPEMNKFFCDSYFKVPNFPQHEEFILANRMYQYFKLVGTETRFKNEQASSFFEKMNEVTDAIVKKVYQNPTSSETEAGAEVAIIDKTFYQSYWCAKFFEKITRTVFIHNAKKEDEPIRVLFTVNPLLPVLSKNTQLDFLKNVDRSDRYVKLFSLMENCDYFYDEITYNQSRSQLSFILKKIQDINFYRLEVFAFIITLVLNLIMIGRLEGMGEAEYGDRDVYYVLMGLAIANAILNALFISFWIYSKFSLVYRIESKKLAVKNNKEKNEKIDESRLSCCQKLYVLYMVLIGRNELTGFIWNLIFSCIGIDDAQTYFLFSIQMFVVINLSETLRNIIRSLTLKYKQLIATTLFVFIACYIFSCIAFFYLSEDFIISIQGKPPNTFPTKYSFIESITGSPVTEMGDTENECGTLLYCFVTHIDYGLRTDGGIGEHLPKRSFTKDPVYYVGRFFYNLFYFILVVVILLSVVFGVVIDAFAELRDQTQREEFDRQNICFICGVKREKLEKNGFKFDMHIKKDHNIWTYAEYIIGLRFIDKQETNAINSYVMEEVEKKQIGWIPSQTEEENEGGKYTEKDNE